MCFKKNNKYDFKFNPCEILIEGNNSFNKTLFCKNLLDSLSKDFYTGYIHLFQEKVILSDKKYKNLFEYKHLDLISEKNIALDYDIVLVNLTVNIINESQKKIVFLDTIYDLKNDENVILFTGQEKYYKDLDTDIPFFNENNITQITEYLLKSFSSPEIYGLVLTGGKSLRMGQDKAFLNYHDIPQYKYVYNLLEKFCSKTFISARKDQSPLYSQEENKIFDAFTDIGPTGGILSAFKFDKTKAWLVVACDLPFIEHATIENIINKRDIKKYATAYISSTDKLPEPLCAIYEPKSKIRLMNFLSLGYECPRKFMINSNVHLINQENEKYLTNINTTEEYNSYNKH